MVFTPRVTLVNSGDQITKMEQNLKTGKIKFQTLGHHTTQKKPSHLDYIEPLSQNDFTALDEKIISTWRSLYDKSMGEIQLDFFSKLRKSFPSPIHIF